MELLHVISLSLSSCVVWYGVYCVLFHFIQLTFYTRKLTLGLLTNSLMQDLLKPHNFGIDGRSIIIHVKHILLVELYIVLRSHVES